VAPLEVVETDANGKAKAAGGSASARTDRVFVFASRPTAAAVSSVLASSTTITS